MPSSFKQIISAHISLRTFASRLDCRLHLRTAPAARQAIPRRGIQLHCYYRPVGSFALEVYERRVVARHCNSASASAASAVLRPIVVRQSTRVDHFSFGSSTIAIVLGSLMDALHDALKKFAYCHNAAESSGRMQQRLGPQFKIRHHRVRGHACQQIQPCALRAGSR